MGANGAYYCDRTYVVGVKMKKHDPAASRRVIRALRLQAEGKPYPGKEVFNRLGNVTIRYVVGAGGRYHAQPYGPPGAADKMMRDKDIQHKGIK